MQIHVHSNDIQNLIMFEISVVYYRDEGDDYDSACRVNLGKRVVRVLRSFVCNLLPNGTL